MHIKTIRIDGYGPWSNQTLEGLSEGLNVFFGGPGSGKSTLRRFIRAILTGFGEAAASPQQMTDHTVIGGTLSAKGPDGRWEISRYQDGTRQGRLILRSFDGTPLDPSLLADIRQMPPAAFDCLLDVDFHGRPSLGRLLDTMTGGGLLQRVEPPRGEPDRSQLQLELEATRRQLHEDNLLLAASDLAPRIELLQSTIERLKERLRSDASESHASESHAGGRHAGRQSLADEVERQTVAVLDLRARLDALDGEADVLRQQPPRPSRPAAPRPSRPAATRPSRISEPASDKDTARLLRQLEALDEQVRRWRRVAHDVEQRREALRSELTQWEMNRARSSTPPQSPRRRLAILEQQVTQLQDHLVQLEAATSRACACRETVERVTPLADQLRQQLYLLCQELTAQQRSLRHEAITNELKQLRRCRLELATHVKRLTDRRQALLKQYGHLDQAGLELFRRAEAGQCDCDHHDQYLESQRHHPAARPVSEPTFEDPLADHRLHRLDELASQRRQLLTRLEAAEIRLREAQQRLDAWRQPTDSAALAEELAARQRQMSALQNEWDLQEQRRDQLRQEIQRLEHLLATIQTVPEPARPQPLRPEPTPQLLELATSYLRRISGGKYVRIGGPGPEGLLWITSHDGQTYPHDVLGPQTYDQLYLSLRLAVADVLGLRGVRIPLILDDPFLNFDVEQHPEILHVLSTFSGAGHQVLVLTGDAAAARLLSERDHLVRDLPRHDVAVSREPARTRQVVTVRRADWDPEEFPGELADRVRVEEEALRQAERRRQHQAGKAPATNGRVVERPWTESRDYLTRLLDGHVGSTLAPPPGSHDPSAASHGATSHGTVSGGNGSATGGHRTSPNLQGPNLKGTGPWRFYLETSSPIEDAPSIGRKMAVQLRGIGVTQVSDLLALSPKAAAAQLAHLTVPSETIRAWQAQAWLVCCVPHLRPYDARILVACGITDPDQLEQMEPRELLERIEKFLVTREGQQIVQSGNDYELARISHWIRMARQTHRRRQSRRATPESTTRPHPASPHPASPHPAGASHGPTPSHIRRPWAEPPVEDPRAGHAGEYLSLDPQAGNGPRLWDADPQPPMPASRPSTTRPSGHSPSGHSPSDSTGGRPAQRELQSGPAAPRDAVRTSTAGRGPESTGTQAAGSPAKAAKSGRVEQPVTAERTRAKPKTSAGALTFYLNTSSPIVDAPAIGPQMAKRLEELGIHTVSDLLSAKPQETARRLDHRRVKAETIRQWQAQSSLVCRVPHLRGHDAQLLVACGYTEPEQLRLLGPEELLAVIGPFAASADGQRIVRSGNVPDLEEVTQWIRWAHHTRPLKAA